MDSQQIMRTALKLAGFSSAPADSEIHVEGKNVRKALVAIDVGVAELLLARELGCDAVIAHHPAGGKAKLEGYKVFERHVGQLVEAGVPEKVAREAIMTKFKALELQHHPDNYDQVPSAVAQSMLVQINGKPVRQAHKYPPIQTFFPITTRTCSERPMVSHGKPIYRGPSREVPFMWKWSYSHPRDRRRAGPVLFYWKNVLQPATVCRVLNLS